MGQGNEIFYHLHLLSEYAVNSFYNYFIWVIILLLNLSGKQILLYLLYSPVVVTVLYCCSYCTVLL